MDLKRLKYFITAAEELNLSRAARSLNVSQPVLSRSIKDLEGEVGAELFYRNPSGVSLTKAGAQLLQSADEILLTWETSMVSLRNMTSGRETVLDVSYVPVVLEPFVGPAMATLGQTHPDLTIRPHEITCHNQVDALRSGEGDVCIVAHDPDAEHFDDFDLFHLCEVKMAAVVSKRDEMASLATAGLRELERRDYVGYDPANQKYCEAMTRSLFERDGAIYRPSMLANSCQSMIASICSGRCYGMLPLIGSLQFSDQFEFIELKSGDENLKVTISGLVKKDENRKSVLAFLQECRRIALVSIPRLEKEFLEQRESRLESDAGVSGLSKMAG